MFPGFDGGGEWGGAAFDPETGLFYVNANEMAWVLRLVKKLVVSVHPPGEYQVTWDGTNEQGREVCSGVYFYRLQAGENKYLKKMVVLR